MKKAILMAIIAIFTLTFASCDNKKEEAKKFLTETATEMNKELPSETDGVIWINAAIHGDDFVYSYLVSEEPDEDFVDELMTVADEYKKVLSSNIQEQFAHNSDFNVFMDHLLTAQLNIVYHYTGEVTNKSISITFTPDEVAALREGVKSAKANN